MSSSGFCQGSTGEEGRGKREEGRGKREEGRGKREESFWKGGAGRMLDGMVLGADRHGGGASGCAGGGGGCV
ncbi:hypothetical protein C7271_10375 [filamentous cyanobacterium CCP5]|nr:hypothetical protein C7271_10375 [filamentous cyanobacterium CCP5]